MSNNEHRTELSSVSYLDQEICYQSLVQQQVQSENKYMRAEDQFIF